MTIDWTLPCETDETPPRPVRVLATDLPAPWCVAAHVGTGDLVMRFKLDGEPYSCMPTLRNVPPPKPEPVLREVWVVWNSEGGRYTPFNTEDDARDLAERVDGVYARAAVMSDGSPVPGEAPVCQYKDHAHLEADRDHWKAKAEALQAEVDRLLIEADPELSTIAYMAGAHDGKVRAEKVEADLTAARAALRWIDRYIPLSYPEDLTPAFDAARAEGGE